MSYPSPWTAIKAMAAAGGGQPPPSSPDQGAFSMVSDLGLLPKSTIMPNSINHIEEFDSMPYTSKTSQYSSLALPGVDNNSYIDTGYNSGNVSPITVMTWARATSISGGRHHLVSSDNGGYDWAILRNSNKWEIAHGGGYQDTKQTLVAGTWIHVAAVFEPKVPRVYFYINGSAVYDRSITTDAGTSNWWFGKNPSFSERWDGDLVSSVIWDKALAANEIADIHAGGHMFDATVNSGKYVSSGNIKFYFRRAVLSSAGYFKNPDTGDTVAIGAGGGPSNLEFIVQPLGGATPGSNIIYGSSLPA